MKKFFAFTLAETLIVMGIIGVVAALTLPNLNNSTGEKEKIAKVKKIYSNLNDALGRAEAVYGPYSEWGSDVEKRAGERITEFMKVTKNCGYSGGGDFGESCSIGENIAKKLDGTTAIRPAYIGGAYFLADGTFICFECDSEDCRITIDIDGPNKGTSTMGVDVFTFLGDDNGIIPLPNNVTSCKGSNGVDCTAWVVQFCNMDYLKADNSGKCKNNTSIVLDGVSNITCK